MLDLGDGASVGYVVLAGRKQASLIKGGRGTHTPQSRTYVLRIRFSPVDSLSVGTVETGPRVGVDYPGTWQAFEAWFGDDDACRAYLVGLRWPDGFVCPACGSRRLVGDCPGNVYVHVAAVVRPR